MQRTPLFAGTAFVAAVLLAACGGGGSSSAPSVVPTQLAPTTAPTTAPTMAPTNPPSMPSTATIGSATVLVGQNGHTLYVFSADTANTSNCGASNGCTGVWPPYAAPAGTTAPSGSGFGIITRSDGTLQWTLGTQPLYEYAGDTAAGTVSGQGITSFGGTWTAGQPASTSTSPTATPYNPYIRIRR
jgi:predicted lipoprotein with Yx(FWY)xxD motif